MEQIQKMHHIAPTLSRSFPLQFEEEGNVLCVLEEIKNAFFIFTFKSKGVLMLYPQHVCACACLHLHAHECVWTFRFSFCI